MLPYALSGTADALLRRAEDRLADTPCRVVRSRDTIWPDRKAVELLYERWSDGPPPPPARRKRTAPAGPDEPGFVLPGASPSPAQVARLRSFLGDRRRPDGTMSYVELRGFLFAVAVAPLLVRPSDWLGMIFNQEEAGYRDIDEARSVLEAIFACYNETVAVARADRPIAPEEVGIADSGEKTLAEWSRGFTDGFAPQRDAWDEALEDFDEEVGEQLRYCSLTLSAWSAREDFLEAGGLMEADMDEALEDCRKNLSVFLTNLAAISMAVQAADAPGGSGRDLPVH
jgi:yecA family protein